MILGGRPLVFEVVLVWDLFVEEVVFTRGIRLGSLAINFNAPEVEPCGRGDVPSFDESPGPRPRSPLRPEQLTRSSEAACAALVAALEENLPVPHGTPIAIWRWVRETTPKRWCAAQFRLGEVYDEAVFVATLEAVRDSGSGTELRQVAIDVLAGSAFAPLLTDDILQDVVDRPHVEPERLTRFVEAVHKARGIPTDMLRAIRDRWASNTVPTTREAAIAVGALISKPEDEFWSMMIDDPHEDVRMSAIQVIAKNARMRFASKHFQERLKHEGVADVRAELHRGMMTVLHREGRGEE